LAKSYYITTPIYYVNDQPHIGHAYTTLACDALARFKRLDGYQVLFATGTDEHGQKIEKSAQQNGMLPQAFTDKVSQTFRDLASEMNFSYDDFIRTTENRHILACQQIWKKLEENKQIYLGQYAGWYAVRDEAFYHEDEVKTLSNGQKIAPTGAEVQWVEEPSYFFRLSAWTEKLLKFYQDNPDFIAPESRRNEVLSFVKRGLQDLSVSRTSFHWGIEVPGNQKHIMYVWLDALTNYLTVAGYPDQKSPKFKNYWPASLHMVGKDIIRFHAIYWPAFLMAADLPPPKRVFAHGWWTNEGQKISKSLGNTVNPLDLTRTYGLDQVRYFLLREVPFGQDGDFSKKALLQRINSDLANDFGNLVQRVLTMIYRECDGKIPAKYPAEKKDEDLLKSSKDLLDTIRKEYDIQAFHKVLDYTWQVISLINRYIDEQAPWSLKKINKARMEAVLYYAAEAIRRVALVTQPVMPQSCNKILDQLGCSLDHRSFRFIDYSLQPNQVIPKPLAIFPRLQD
jgi:methionyl-tRNA synthetase